MVHVLKATEWYTLKMFKIMNFVSCEFYFNKKREIEMDMSHAVFSNLFSHVILNIVSVN